MTDAAVTKTKKKRRPRRTCTASRPWGSSRNPAPPGGGVCVYHVDSAPVGIDLRGCPVLDCPHCGVRFSCGGESYGVPRETEAYERALGGYRLSLMPAFVKKEGSP